MPNAITVIPNYLTQTSAFEAAQTWNGTPELWTQNKARPAQMIGKSFLSANKNEGILARPLCIVISRPLVSKWGSALDSESTKHSDRVSTNTVLEDTLKMHILPCLGTTLPVFWKANKWTKVLQHPDQISLKWIVTHPYSSPAYRQPTLSVPMEFILILCIYIMKQKYIMSCSLYLNDSMPYLFCTSLRKSLTGMYKSLFGLQELAPG